MIQGLIHPQMQLCLGLVTSNFKRKETRIMGLQTIKKHITNFDGCCRICGLDRSEFYWWKNNTYEGKASDVVEPVCKEIPISEWNKQSAAQDAEDADFE
jgi:uncharacterized metal-binding protein